MFTYSCTTLSISRCAYSIHVILCRHCTDFQWKENILRESIFTVQYLSCNLYYYTVLHFNLYNYLLDCYHNCIINCTENNFVNCTPDENFKKWKISGLTPTAKKIFVLIVCNMCVLHNKHHVHVLLNSRVSSYLMLFSKSSFYYALFY